MTGDLQPFEGSMQVPRCVWIVQHSYVLEPAGDVQGGRQPAEAALRRSSPGGVQRARYVVVSRREHHDDEEEEAKEERRQ